MLHRPQDRVLFVSPHAKMVDVDSIFLKEGQIGIYDTKDTSENGCKAVIDFTGKPQDFPLYPLLSALCLHSLPFSTLLYA